MNKVNNNVIEINKNIPITFTVKGNYNDKDGRYFSTEVLYKAWKDYIGKGITCINNEERIVSDVTLGEDDYIFIETISKV